MGQAPWNKLLGMVQCEEQSAEANLFESDHVHDFRYAVVYREGTYLGLAFTTWHTGRLHTTPLTRLCVLGKRGVLIVSVGGLGGSNRSSSTTSHC